MRPYFLVLVFVAGSLLAQNPIVQKSNTNENLRGVSALAENVAWASGTHWSSWLVAQVPGAEALDFRDVEPSVPIWPIC